MHRFFVPSNILSRGRVHLTGGPYEQIRRVLRMRVGDGVVLFDGSGYEYTAKLVEFGKGEVIGEVVERREVLTEPTRRVDLYLSLLNKSEKFEWALQKCTELGANRFVPVKAARSVTSHDRPERWERIILEAAEQSGRGVLPALAEAMPLGSALYEAAGKSRPGSGLSGAGRLVLMPEVGAAESLGAAVSGAGDTVAQVALFIGPEGGFTEDEQRQASEAGVRIVSLGPRVLRAETAAVVALSLVMAYLGEI